jgi:hypothetical protein
VKKKVLWSLTGFVVVLAVHVLYTISEAKQVADRWVTVSQANYLSLYFEQGQYLIGASYALAIGFSIYALVRFIESQRKGFAGIIGGVTLTGVLYVAGCFFLGCCGSPMLAVYLTLFGSSFLGFTKPLTFILTFASVIVGYIWMERNSPKQVVDGKLVDVCCEGEEECPPASGRQTDIALK